MVCWERGGEGKEKRGCRDGGLAFSGSWVEGKREIEREAGRLRGAREERREGEGGFGGGLGRRDGGRKQEGKM